MKLDGLHHNGYYRLYNNGVYIDSRSLDIPSSTAYIDYELILKPTDNLTFLIGTDVYCGGPGQMPSRDNYVKDLAEYGGGTYGQISGCAGGAAISNFRPTEIVLKSSMALEPAQGIVPAHYTICSGSQLFIQAAFPNKDPSVLDKDYYPDEAFHWQYSIDGKTNWVNIPKSVLENNNPQSYNPRILTNTVEQIIGADPQNYNKIIFFRLGYYSLATNELEYGVLYSPCAPVIIAPIDYVGPQCHDEKFKKLKVIFDRNLETGEVLNIMQVRENKVSSTPLLFLPDGETINNLDDEHTNPPTYSYTFPVGNLNSGTFHIEYEATKNGTPRGLISDFNPNFTYTNPEDLVITAVKKNDVLCNGDKTGSIDIIASGGTGSYSYILNPPLDLNNSLAEVPFTSPHTINGLGKADYTVTLKDSNNCQKIANPVEINEPSAITITGNQVNVNEYNTNTGQITNLVISGGSGSYTTKTVTNHGVTSNITGNLLTGLYAGDCIIDIIDSNNCSKSVTFKIKQPDLLNVSISIPPKITCFGGNTGVLTTTSSGGYPFLPAGTIPNYTYKWFATNASGTNAVEIYQYNKDAKDLKAGFYKVSIQDEAGIIAFSNVMELKQNDQIIITPKIADIKCKEDASGSIELDINGGTGIYDIQWSDGNTNKDRVNLTEGLYKYAVTDRNVSSCSISGSVYITEPNSILSINPIIQTQPTSPLANDGTIKIAASGGTPQYTYTWTKNGDHFVPNTNITTGVTENLANGKYQVIITDANNCEVTSDEIFLEALAIKLENQTNVKCKGLSTGSIKVKATGGKGSGYSYQWHKMDGSTEIFLDGEEEETIIDLPAGIVYRVKVNDGINPEIFADFKLDEPMSILTATSVSTDVICFGGSSGTITLDIQGGTAPYSATFKDVNNTNATIDPTQLQTGTYSYIVSDKNDCPFPSPQNIFIAPNTLLKITSVTEKQPTLFSAYDGEITINAEGGAVSKYTFLLKKNGAIIPTEYSTNIITGLGDGSYEVAVKDNNNCISASQTIILKALAINFVSKLDITCNGKNTGNIEVATEGGTTSTSNQYNYKWYFKQKVTDSYVLLDGQIAKKAENLYAGFYKVIVTDDVNISRELEIAEVTERPAITFTHTKTNVNCFKGTDGTITLDIKGGTGLYTVVWKDIIDSNKTIDPTQLTAGDYSFSITDANSCDFTSPNSIDITQPLKPLTISTFNITNVSGFDLKNGSIEVTPAGGTGSYAYQWYEGTAKTIMTGKENALLDGIGKGTYTVIVTDENSCTTEETYTVLQPDKLKIKAITQTEFIKCHGDKTAILNATIEGGAPIGVLDADKNYIYKWYNKLTPTITASTTNPSGGLLAGDYFLEVSDGFGNSFTSNLTAIAEPDLLEINYTQTNVSCKNDSDGAITIGITGGTAPFDIVWSTGQKTTTITGLLASTYTVTVTDGKLCQTSQDITITEPETLYLSKIIKTPPSTLGANDASIAITVAGGTKNYNFKWYDENKNLIYTDNNQNSDTSIYNIYAGQYFITVTDFNGCTILERDLDKVDPLLVKGNQINIIKCHGNATASIKAITSGGTPVYYYEWYDVNNPNVIISKEETLTNVKAGTYYVIAGDSFGLSSQSENITVTQPTPLKNSLSSTYTRCGDGNDWSINSAVSDGTAPYSYLWNTEVRTANLNTVMPDNYSLLVTDNNGCTIRNTINVIAPPHLSASQETKIPTCFEGADASITVTPVAGIAPYNYLWNTGEKSNILSNAKAGNYSVAITDAKGCIINENYTIENPPQDVITLGADVTLCFGQSLTINAAIDDDKATYSWTSTKGFKSDKPMITVSDPANYTLIVTNKLGCKASDTITIASQNTAINAEFALSSQVFVDETIVIIDLSNPHPDSIEWILPAGAVIESKNNDYAEISFPKAGEYEIRMNSTKGNCTAFQTKNILVLDGEYKDPDSNDLQKKFEIKIYPNPSNGIFTVDVSLDKIMPATIKIFSLINNNIIETKSETGKQEYLFDFNLNNLTPGVYFVLLESQQGSKLRKIIIQ